MADPVRGKVIAVTVTNGNEGERVTFRNLSRSSATITESLNSDGKAVINTANIGVAWQSGDAIQVQVSGRINQSKQITLRGGGGGTSAVTLSSSVDTSTPAVDL